MQLPAARVSGSFFAALGVHPALGRGLSPEEDKEGSAQAVVLTDGLWKREFNGDRRVLGQSVVLSGRSYTVVGVMPASFRFPLLRDAQLIVPAGWTKDDLQTRGLHSWSVFGRLKPGASVASAQADLDVLGPRIASRLPNHTGQTLRAVPLHDDLVGPVKPVLEALLGAVILVLLIACANVASMLLARGAARQRELAIRAALGERTDADRPAAAHGVGAPCGGRWRARPAARCLGRGRAGGAGPRVDPRLDEVRLDGTVLTFALVISLAAGVAAGLIPALQASRPDVVEALKSGAGALSGRNRARSVLVVVEIALALVLVIGAGLMIRTLVRLLDVRTGMGVDPAHVFVAEINLPQDRYPDPASTLAFQQRLLDRVATLPGVQSAAVTTGVPMDPNFQASLSFEIVGDPTPPAGQTGCGGPLAIAGRAADARGPAPRGSPAAGHRRPEGDQQVLLVNQAFVRKFLGGGRGAGRQLKRFLKDDDKDVWTIVGVFADVHTQRLDRLPAPQIVLPEAQSPQPFMRVLLRTGGFPMTLAPLVRTEVLALDKDLPVGHPQTLERVIAESLGERRFQMTLLTVFGAIALLLASVGIYGVVAYSVAQRSKEIGIRMALGAQRSSVLRMVVGSGLRLALFGVGIGLIGAIAVTQALRRTLYQVSATDPLTFAAVAVLLIAIALLASWAPARRAAQVDPMDALRAE